jgi:hypothetical protein
MSQSRRATRPRATKIGSGGDTLSREAQLESLLADLDESIREYDELWKRYAEGAYEMAFHRKPTQHDLAVEVRSRMKGDLPETIRWRLALLVGGPLSYE